MQSIFRPVIENIAVIMVSLAPIAACSSGDQSPSSLGRQADQGGASAAPNAPIDTSSSPPIDKSANPRELPDTIWPRDYKLWFRPDAALQTFTGRGDVELEVLKPVEAITVAARNLKMVPGRTTLRPLSDPFSAIPLLPTPQTLGDFVALRLNEGQIAPGRYQLHMEWTGQIQFSDADFCPPDAVARNPFCSAASGVFKVGLFSPDGVSSDAIVTQGETDYERQWFPGWDEPAFRLTFEVTAEVPGDWKTVSNGASRPAVVLPDGYQQVSFGKTPPMPTYLLFFGGGKFDTLEDDFTSPLDGRTMHLRWFTPPSRAAWAAPAMQWTKEALAFYYDYTGISLPLEKFDTVAANDSYNNKPRTGFGGMENWGSIFEFANRVLTQPGNVPTGGSIHIVTHELAHQWFGDLVTLDWWDDVFLNESFANWFENKTTILLHPEYETFADYVNSKNGVFRADLRDSALPVQRNLSETGAFGFVSPSTFVYNKGGLVLQMLENYLGADAMKEGLRIYLRNYAFGNVTPERLWASLEQGSGRKVADIGDSFIRQTGVPLVTIDTQCTGGKTYVSIAQQAFPNQNPFPASKWAIPLTLAFGDALQQRQTIVLSDMARQIALPGCTAVLANPTGLDYYVTNYSGPAWSALLAKVQAIASNKAVLTNIVNDALRLLNANLISQAQYDQIKNVINLPAPQGQAGDAELPDDAVVHPHALRYRGEPSLREGAVR